MNYLKTELILTKLKKKFLRAITNTELRTMLDLLATNEPKARVYEKQLQEKYYPYILPDLYSSLKED